MKNILRAGLLWVITTYVCLQIHAQNSNFSAGSFIVNMGVVPQTIANGLKPYGMVYDLVQNYDVPVYWIINPNKLKDGIDFSYNSVDYKGGPFVIALENRNATVDARIAYWQGQGVAGTFAASSFSAPVAQIITAVPRWTLDLKSGQLAHPYFQNAGIPIQDINMAEPALLGSCNDIFVLPHADPTWNTHNFLVSWNNTNRGSIWSSCHAVSVLENMYNTAVPTQQANFLALNSGGPGSQALVPFGSHNDGSVPFNNNSYPTDPPMQFMGSIDLATTNGSEQIYLPALGGGWRPTTKVCVYDPTHVDVTSNSPGRAASLVYGRGFGDNNRGWVMYEGGHSHNKGEDYSVAAQRIFFNFGYMATLEKSMNLTLTGIQSVMISNNNYNLSVGVQQAVPSGPYTYQWTSSCGGTFSNNAIANPVFTPPMVGSPVNCVISVKVKDACNRSRFITQNILVTSGPRPPVAIADSLTFSPDCINVNPVITLNPLGNDSEPDGQPLSISSVSGSNGSWVINPDQTVNYIPDPGFYGTTTANYTVCDNSFPVPYCSSSTIKVTISSAIAPPTPAADSFTIYEDSISRFNVLSNDLPAGTLNVAGITTKPLHGKLSINPDNTISYLPDADYTGLDSFYYTVSSGGYFATAKVIVTIVHDCCSPGNYKQILGPVITTTQTLTAIEDSYLKLKNATTNFGTSTDIVLDRETTDKHVGVVKFDFTALACYATLVRSATLKMFRTSGTDQVISTYRLTKNWSENQVTWNDRLTGTAWTTQGGDYNGAELIDATGTPVANIYNWNATNIVHNMVCSTALYPNYGFIARVDATGGNRVTTFASRENTSAGIIKPSLQVTFDSAAFICVPIPVRPPMAMPDTAATESKASVLINSLANDQLPGLNTGVVSLIPSSITSGSATISANMINYIPDPTYQGITSFQYVITDNVTGLKDTASLFVYVTFPAPEANNDTLVIYSNETGSIDILANDVDLLGLGLTSTILNTAKHGNVSQTGSTIYYTAPFNFYGRDTITYRIANNVGGFCNEQNAADTAHLFIFVQNRIPLATNDTASTNPCQPIAINVLSNDVDPENGNLSITSVYGINPAGAGTATFDGSTIYFTPNSSFAGTSAAISYIVGDDVSPQGLSAPASVVLSLDNFVNLAPVAINDTISCLYNADSYISVLDNDSDPENDGLTVSLSPSLLQPANGTITIEGNGLVKYTPSPGFIGIDQFEYRISDSHFGPSGGSCSSVSQSSLARVFVVISTNIVLAQNDIRLYGTRFGNNNLLAWEAKETDIMATYILEKSTDGRSFEAVTVMKQNNYSSSTKTYEFSDNVSLTTVFYRVKLLRSGVPAKYSNIVVLKYELTAKNCQIYPVPFKDRVNLNVFSDTREKIDILLSNSQGSTVRNKSYYPRVGFNYFTLDQLGNLPSGFYFIRIRQRDLTYTQKIIKAD